MKNKRKYIIFIIIVAIVIGIPVGKHIYENSHVKFTDETMGKVICETMHGKNITPENVTYKDLKEIKELVVGFSGYYKTLKDIKYCTDLEELSINWKPANHDPAYAINQGKVDKELSKAEIEAVQEGLGEILPELPNLKILWLSNFGGSNWTSVDFLKNCDQIEQLFLHYSCATDYSALKTCKSLKEIFLEYSQISEAEDLAGLENVESIDVYGTPLAEKPKEVKKLQEMYPNAEIYYER